MWAGKTSTLPWEYRQGARTELRLLWCKRCRNVSYTPGEKERGEEERGCYLCLDLVTWRDKAYLTYPGYKVIVTRVWKWNWRLYKSTFDKE